MRIRRAASWTASSMSSKVIKSSPISMIINVNKKKAVPTIANSTATWPVRWNNSRAMTPPLALARGWLRRAAARSARAKRRLRVNDHSLPERQSTNFSINFSDFSETIQENPTEILQMKFPLAQSVDRCQDRYSTPLPAGAIANPAAPRAVVKRNGLERVAASTSRIARLETDWLAATIPLSWAFAHPASSSRSPPARSAQPLPCSLRTVERPRVGPRHRSPRAAGSPEAPEPGLGFDLEAIDNVDFKSPPINPVPRP